MLSLNLPNDWWKWGQPDKRKSLEDYPQFKHHLERLWNKKLSEKHPVAQSFDVISDEERSGSIFRLFQKELPDIKISTDPELRLKRSFGKSYPDLIGAAMGTPVEIADAVIFPCGHEDVLHILRIASEQNILVFPFGGGTNVVGAFKMPGREKQARIAVDLSLMNRLISFDEENHTATFECGILGPLLESSLNRNGYTLGHFPQSFEFSTLGGWIATRSAGQESSTYGRIEDMVIALTVATPTGTLHAGNYQGDAEGINMKHLFYGSEGMLGIMSEAKLLIHKLPQTKRWMSFLFAEYEQGLKALKEMIQLGIFPSVVRYSDEHETFFLSLMSNPPHSAFSKIKSSFTRNLLKWKKLHHPGLLMVRIDGSEQESAVKKRIAETILKKHGGFSAGERLGLKWEKTRFGLPYLQDDLIERGIFIDTMETVLPWDKINELRLKLYDLLRSFDDFNREKGILLAHVSHVYDSCASIYFTVITQQDRSRPYEQWKNIKTLVINTIVAHGGAVSHHHSIGTDLRKWYTEKTSSLTREILSKMKTAVDPNHILNPGKLFDE